MHIIRGEVTVLAGAQVQEVTICNTHVPECMDAVDDFGHILFVVNVSHHWVEHLNHREAHITHPQGKRCTHMQPGYNHVPVLYRMVGASLSEPCITCTL